MHSIYEKARAFVYRNARPLDLARWQYHFENGSGAAVWNALAYYQNEDGGFGHALEPDCWNPCSSPIQTWCATELLRETGLRDPSNPLIAGILHYLTSGDSFDGQGWFCTVASNHDAPHAPWWHTDSRSACHADDNPTACLAGFLLRFAPPGTAAQTLGCHVAQASASRLAAPSPTRDMHTLACYLRLYEYAAEAGNPAALDLPAMQASLQAHISSCLTQNTDLWETSYVCKPSQFFHSPAAPCYPGNEQLTAYECDFLERTQLKDGSWKIPWSWSEYPEQWSISKNWWKANGILANLLFLKGFGRL
ncbi:MAG: hypothetical protein RSA65_06285 [Clostridia bacterium]